MLLFYNCKFPYRFTLKYINLKLKFRKDKSYHVKRTAHLYTITSLLLKPLKQRLIDIHFVPTFEIALFSICSVQTR
jgi:hypothetical protein